MFPKEITQGFVFKKEDFGEADRIFSVFTKDFGRLELIGRGIRKISSKLKGKVEIFSFLNLEFVRGKYQKILTQAEEILIFPELKKNFSKTILAFQISEILDRLIKEEEREEKIFELLKEVFSNFRFFPLKKISLLYLYFFWRLISILGYQPRVKECEICGKRFENFAIFDFEKLAFVCKKCSKSAKIFDKIDLKNLKILSLLIEKEIDFLKRLKIENRDLDFLFQFSKNYLNFTQRDEIH